MIICVLGKYFYIRRQQGRDHRPVLFVMPVR